MPIVPLNPNCVDLERTYSRAQVLRLFECLRVSKNSIMVTTNFSDEDLKLLASLDIFVEHSDGVYFGGHDSLVYKPKEK